MTAERRADCTPSRWSIIQSDNHTGYNVVWIIEFTARICSCMVRPAHNPSDGSSLVFLRLHRRKTRQYEDHVEASCFLPEMTAIFTLPCSSRAIRSASSINNVPKPCE